MSELPSKERLHTPGPWMVKPHGAIVGGTLQEFHNGSGYRQVAMACAVDEGSQEANAELIASAPDMLKEIARLRNLLTEAESEVRELTANARRVAAHEPPVSNEDIVDQVYELESACISAFHDLASMHEKKAKDIALAELVASIRRLAPPPFSVRDAVNEYIANMNSNDSYQTGTLRHFAEWCEGVAASTKIPVQGAE